MAILRLDLAGAKWKTSYMKVYSVGLSLYQIQKQAELLMLLNWTFQSDECGNFDGVYILANTHGQKTNKTQHSLVS